MLAPSSRTLLASASAVIKTAGLLSAGIVPLLRRAYAARRPWLHSTKQTCWRSPKTLAKGCVWVDEGAVGEPRPIERGVVLPEGHTGSSLFHRVLAEAVREFPN